MTNPSEQRSGAKPGLGQGTTQPLEREQIEADTLTPHATRVDHLILDTKTDIVVYSWLDPLNPKAGGDVKFLKEIARRFVRDGHRVAWVSSRFEGSALEDSWEGVRVIRTGGLYTVYLAHHLDKRTRRLASHATTIESIASIPFFIRQRRRGRSVIVIHHVVPFNQMLQKIGVFGLAAYVVDRVLTPGLYRDSRVLVPSKGTEADVRRLGYHDVRIIREGVDHVRLSTLRKEKIVVAPGPIKPWKHHESIIRAFTCVDSSWRLVIFGAFETNSVRQGLESVIESCHLSGRVSLRGWITDAEKHNLLDRAAIGVFASEKEGWGLAAMEVQAHGCAVVAFNVQGLNESVIDGLTGVLVNRRKEHDLGLAIEKLVQDEESLSKMSREASLHAEDYDWESCYQDLRRNVER